MKVLIVDFYAKGHHREYMENMLAVNQGNQILAVYPVEVAGADRTYLCAEMQVSNGFSEYRKFLRQLNQIIRDEQPDVVHFLTGDLLYRYFGVGLHKVLSKQKSIVTFHHIRSGRLHRLSLQHICSAFDTCVVHSDSLRKQLTEAGVYKGTTIQYPHFHVFSEKTVNEIRSELGIPQDAFVLGSFGGTRADKGLDILLQAMQTVVQNNQTFYLLIAGKPVDFDEAFIREQTKCYSDRVKALIKPIPDELYEDCLKCVDAVVLPYRKCFNGASGPLNEGVAYGKVIVGPNHGNLGSTIRENHLGFCFDTEKTESLAEAILQAMTGNFTKDSYYEAYHDSLNPEIFRTSYRKLYQSICK